MITIPVTKKEAVTMVTASSYFANSKRKVTATDITTLAAGGAYFFIDRSAPGQLQCITPGGSITTIIKHKWHKRNG